MGDSSSGTLFCDIPAAAGEIEANFKIVAYPGPRNSQLWFVTITANRKPRGSSSNQNGNHLHNKVECMSIKTAETWLQTSFAKLLALGLFDPAEGVCMPDIEKIVREVEAKFFLHPKN